jgi:hypothetical protein
VRPGGTARAHQKLRLLHLIEGWTTIINELLIARIALQLPLVALI